MELKITELNDSLLDVDTEKINVVKSEPLKPILKYKNPILKNENKKEAKRVSYDDILAKMGMYVDNGKLHLADKNTNTNSCGPSSSLTCKVKCARLQQHLAQPQNAPMKNVPIPSSAPMQNSYIYNKYFKDQVKPVEQVLVPKTPEEYKQMLIKKLLERKIQQQRIRQIKSTKLIMPTENISVAPEPRLQNRFFKF